MKRPGGAEVLVGVMAGALFLLGAVAGAQPPGSIPPLYTQRLRMPVRGDDFAQPRAVVADLHTGEVFVCDSLGNRVVIFDERGRFRYQIRGGSTFQSPIDLAVDPEGYLFVLSQVSVGVTLLDFDGRFIRRVSLTGLPEDVESPRFSSLAISPSGESLYMMDPENDRLWITNRDGAIQGSIDMTVGRPQEEIDQLRYGHIDVYADTLLVPIPTDGMVHLFDLEGRAKGTIGAQGSAECQTMFPAAAALDDQGRVIILDQQRALFMTWDLARGVCLSEHYGFGNAPGAFYQPSDLALDAAGRLYVSQGFEGRVQVYEGAQPASMLLAARQPAPAEPEEPTIADVGVVEPETVPGSPAEEATIAAAVEPTPEPLLEPAPTTPPAEPALRGEPVVARDVAPTLETVEVGSPELGAVLAAGARLSVERAPRYDPSYIEIAYPGGDLPLDRGAAVDVVVRAFRHAEIDLQEAVHEDLLGALGAYGVEEPDPNIDHRRIRNLVTFFERRSASLSVEPGGDWAPGDIVFWDRNADGAAGHLGVVIAETGPSGEPLVVHHHRPEGEFAGTPDAADVLFRWPVAGHYRWSFETEDVGVRPAPEQVPTPQPSTELGAMVAEGARLSVERAPRYDSSYTEIAYPGGDVPPDRGAAIDVVVRAFRHAGVDLQEAVHNDLLEALGAYGVNEPDPNIDHRRIRNLVTFFERRAESLSTETSGDWAPGDVVFWDRNSDAVAGHLGVVTGETGPSGNLMVVHHHRPEGEFSGTPAAADVLFRWPVVGHYRWSSEAEDR
jgi:uncharacterized protein YijF (DUF1287 family)/sugar lactone lactonase YvrE